MKRSLFPHAIVSALLIIGLSACAVQQSTRGGLGAYKVGSPYQIKGVWYYPKEDPFYDETGIASWYGSDFHGKATANGEQYDMNSLTAAHRTLPLPTIVRVTNLENGRSILLRVNDRGPYARGRIIDVSKRAADLLGFQGRGTARVRVQFEGRGKVGAPPPETEDDVAVAANAAPKAAPLSTVVASELPPVNGAAAATGRPVQPLPAPPVAAQMASDVEPDGKISTLPVPTQTQLWVQVGAFISRPNADRLAERLRNVSPAKVTTTVQSGKTIFRVRTGPYTRVEDADIALDKVINAGQNGAQIVVE